MPFETFQPTARPGGRGRIATTPTIRIDKLGATLNSLGVKLLGLRKTKNVDASRIRISFDKRKKLVMIDRITEGELTFREIKGGSGRWMSNSASLLDWLGIEPQTIELYQDTDGGIYGKVQ